MDIRITHVIELSPALMALLVSASTGAIAAGTVSRNTATDVGGAEHRETRPAAAAEEAAPATDAATSAAADAGDVDTGGWPWSSDLHAATKGKTKEGYWRMKVGVARPDPKPGFPVASTGGGATGTTSNGAASPASETAPASTAGPVTDAEDDEFAAFRQAAANADANDAAAAAAAPARKWTDADLGALCNQAAVKLGDPTPVKTIIGEFVPEGQVPHSRNVPEADRAAFAAAVEKAAGITFAG
jgi:hypothetical protein